VVDVLLVLIGLWRLLFSFSLCFFLLVFLAEGYTGHLCWGVAFHGGSPASFSGCAFFMSFLEPDLCSSAGSFMTHASLWWRSLEIGCFGNHLLQREVPDEGACLQFTRASAGDSFFPSPVLFGFCLGFLFVFLFTVCLCNAQLLLDYLLAYELY
jgi:hypothetical protein